MASPFLTRPGAVAAADVDPPPPNPATAPLVDESNEPDPRAALKTPPVPPVTDHGVAAHYGDPLREQKALARGEALVDLSHRGVLTVTGPDRLTWLHSLTTQHLRDMQALDSVEALVLSPKGHVDHAVHVVDDGINTTWLTVEPGTQKALLAWLTSMVFLTRVEVADVTSDFAVLGHVALSTDFIVFPGVVWRDPWPGPVGDTAPYGPVEGHPGVDRRRYEIIVPRTQLPTFVQGKLPEVWAEEPTLPTQLKDRFSVAGTWAWEALRIEDWRPRLGLESDHRTIPHELDWLRTAVHLHKGCYRGQETVARVHNLGRPPRRLVMLHLDGSGHQLPAPGQELTVPGGPRPVGRITSRALHHELGPIALAVVKRNTDPTATLHAGDIACAQTVIVAP